MNNTNCTCLKDNIFSIDALISLPKDYPKIQNIVEIIPTVKTTVLRPIIIPSSDCLFNYNNDSLTGLKLIVEGIILLNIKYTSPSTLITNSYLTSIPFTTSVLLYNFNKNKTPKIAILSTCYFKESICSISFNLVGEILFS